MQIVIDIDEARFKDIQRIAEVQLNRRTDTVEQLIAKGTPIPDNATNGDVIKVMFPSVRVNERNVELLGGLDGFSHRFNKTWWNARYKAESEDKE